MKFDRLVSKWIGGNELLQKGKPFFFLLRCFILKSKEIDQKEISQLRQKKTSQSIRTKVLLPKS